eukprot:4963752-Amphidinium_carterae.1
MQLHAENEPEAHHMAWWPLSYNVKLGSGEYGLLIDLGSFGNLVGEQWVQEVSTRADRHGLHTHTQTRNQPLRVGGVAKATEEATKNVMVPIAFARSDGRIETGTYTAPMLPQSGCPALLGLQSLAAMGAVLDCAAKKLYIRGSPDQDVEIRIPPG